ncbi:MAG: Re/Si-specific NAD(P)(+) transhydrogenase subunit alpha [Planctomycetes bacterium]|nr:Re/Si-specific NAD(P)(+) transhydrogenase subunit alpha [Planctomycetota bacterium]
MVSVFIPKETPEDERRVAATPDTVKQMVKKGVKVVIQAGAGERSHFSDEAYAALGATIEADRNKGLAEADLVMQITVPEEAQIKQMKEGSSLISFLWAFEHLDLVKALNDRKISLFAMDAIPRTTRAQKDDALSSQANLAGYKAVLVAANHLHKILPMMMTPSGTIKPSRFVIIGVGVAGLQAIATAKRLGAIVEATDPRPETKEQAESLGAKFLEVEGVEVKKGTGGYAAEQTEEYKKAQADMLAKAFQNADAIITTALIPYRPAPKTISAEHVKSMKDGSVIVDLAAERGGNCELTESGKTVVKEGVTIVGDLNWPSTLGVHASEMYARNVLNILLDSLTKEGELVWTYEDDIVDGAMVCHAGEVHHPKVRELMGLPPLKKEEPEKQPEPAASSSAEASAKAEAAGQAAEKPAEEAKKDDPPKEEKPAEESK